MTLQGVCCNYLGRMHTRTYRQGTNEIDAIDQAVLCLKLSGIGERRAEEEETRRYQFDQNSLPHQSLESSLNSSFKGSTRSQKRLNSSVRRPATDRFLPLATSPPPRPPSQIGLAITRTISLCYCSTAPMSRQPSELSNFFSRQRKTRVLQWAEEGRESAEKLNPPFERIANILPRLGNVEKVRRANQRLIRTNEELLRDGQDMGERVKELEQRIRDLQQEVQAQRQEKHRLRESLDVLQGECRWREEQATKTTLIMQQHVRENNDLKEKMRHLKKQILRMRHEMGEVHLLDGEKTLELGGDSF